MEVEEQARMRSGAHVVNENMTQMLPRKAGLEQRVFEHLRKGK